MDPIEIREIPPEQAGLVNALVTREFPYQGNHRYFDDFPVWGSDRVVRLGAFSGSTLLSHAGYRLARMKTPAGTVPVALIGAVATDGAHRGKGLSTRLLNEVLARIDRSDAEWTLLWGSEHDFYARFGFRPEGRQCRALIADLSISPKDLSAPAQGLTDAILQDLMRQESGIELTPADAGWLSAHQTVAWYSLKSPFAWIAYQKGLDMPNIVHEAGGDPEGIRKLLFQIYRMNPSAEILGTSRKLQTLGFPSAALFEENLCLARPRKSGMIWNPGFWVSGLSAC